MNKMHELTIGTHRTGHSLAERAIAGLRLFQLRRAQRRELSELLQRDERLLHDLGIDRADVLRELRKPFWVA